MLDRLALVIGARKTGTTALFRYLEQHPQLATSRDKETNWFCRPEVRARGWAWYEAQFGYDPTRHRWALEASPNYTRHPEFEGPPVTAREFPGELRFIYLVRDPIARVRSSMLHDLAAGWRTESFLDGLPEAMVQVSNYRAQVERYVEAFGRDAILVQRHEDLIAEPRKVLRRVFRFLGVKRFVRLEDPGPQNSGSMYRALLVCRALAERGLIPALAADDQEPEAHHALHVRRARDPAIARAAAQVAAELEARITPSPAQQAELRARLEPDLPQFTRAWGVDPWGR